ncbi:MAG: PEGA domain-containing protein [Nitrospiraceae bacterium]|nr:PEGA domain-containing protein [Nitrospiraceae bacterium]
MRKQLFLLLLLLCCSIVLTGCASIISGSTQEVTFQSQPEGATVSVDGKPLGKTPFTTTLKKKNDQKLTFEKEGYKTETMQLTTHLNPWFFGNIIFGGLLGSTTDGLSGSIHEYVPAQYFIPLTPLDNTRLDPLTEKKNKAKKFIVLEYKNIMSDISRGSGEYLNSLMDLLSVAPTEQKEATTRITALSETHKDPLIFADKIIELYVK